MGRLAQTLGLRIRTMSTAQEVPLENLRGRPLANVTCPYCGSSIDRSSRTKEHVIGRRFVPVGTLNNCWNLIVWACLRCNKVKSDLEDDISAITMHFHTVGLSPMDDSIVQMEAKRKGVNSFSRRTGKPVAESAAKLNIHGKIGSYIEVNGLFTAPPQLDDQRSFELARLQMIAFFYFLTYNKIKNVGHFWQEGFYPIQGAIKSDWGNPVHRAFMTEIVNWDYRLVLTTASGYYRAIIRRHPSKDCWAWAVEWNDCYRLVGFFGDFSASKEIADRLPDLPVHSILESQNQWLRYRREEMLLDEDDILFNV